MSIKKALLENLFKLKSKVNSQPEDPASPNSEVIHRSQSSNNINVKVINFPSRPSSVCSKGSISNHKSIKPKTLAEPFSSLFKTLTVKKVSEYNKALIDDNSSWLLTSLIYLISLADETMSKLPSKLMRYQVVKIFKDYAKNPGNFIRVLKLVPGKVLDRKDLRYGKIIEASFRLVDYSRLKSFHEIFSFVRECIEIMTKAERTGTPESGLIKVYSVSPIRSPLTKTQKINTSSYRSSIKSSSSIKSKSPYKAESASRSFLKTQDFNEINQTCKILFQKMNSKSKAEKFLIDSRVNKRVQEKLKKFLDQTPSIEKSEVSNEELKDRLIENFMKTLPVSEVSSSCIKFLDYYKKTSEFERLIKKFYSP